MLDGIRLTFPSGAVDGALTSTELPPLSPCLKEETMNRFEQFLKERTYLNNVSPRTIEWHTQSLKWLALENPTEAECKAAVLRMREAGLKASSVNCRIRSINAYLKWSGSTIKLSKMKEPTLALSVFSQADIQKFMGVKPKGFYERRLQTLVLMLADVGARISELLGLKWEEIDFDNLLVKLTGKGSKDRIVPFSIELRKRLYRLKQESKHSLVFPTRDGGKLMRRNVLRDVKELCEDLGIKPPARLLHAFRHSFATTYLKRGGGVAYLQKTLGHSAIATTMRYAHLNVEDLQKIHEKISLLA
jgi:integrase/recombinase XerD